MPSEGSQSVSTASTASMLGLPQLLKACKNMEQNSGSLHLESGKRG